MKLTLLAKICFAICLLFLSSCATLIGGSKYNAHVIVRDRPNAEIIYRGKVQGKGKVAIQVHRNEAHVFAFSVKEAGCKEQKYYFTRRTFRGWTCAGSILLGTIIINAIPIPIAFITDLSTSGIWKPCVKEAGVSKNNYKNFRYTVNYTACPEAKFETSQQLLDVIYLKNSNSVKGIILEQEPTVSLKIQTQDGNIAVYKFEEIEKIIKE